MLTHDEHTVSRTFFGEGSVHAGFLHLGKAVNAARREDHAQIRDPGRTRHVLRARVVPVGGVQNAKFVVDRKLHDLRQSERHRISRVW